MAGLAIVGIAITVTVSTESGRLLVGKLTNLGPATGGSRSDWPQLGGGPHQNSEATDVRVPANWNADTGRNVRWASDLGTQTYSTPVAAGGRVFIGTNNGRGYLARFPATEDLGCLLCLDEGSGEFRWQHSSRKLSAPELDLPQEGLSGSPAVERDRLFFVTNRAEVQCLDAAGFRDGENDGPYQVEESEDEHEADLIWSLDMIQELGVSPHHAGGASVTIAEGVVLVNTMHSLRKVGDILPDATAPSFVAVDKQTGKLLWKDSSPGHNLVNAQWSSPAYFVDAEGRRQAIFAGGDGWIYSFELLGDGNGQPKLHWKFDCTSKATDWVLGGQTYHRNADKSRDNIVSTPVVRNGLVYVIGMRMPKQGKGNGVVWCIDASRSGDISPTLAADMEGRPIDTSVTAAEDQGAGEREIPNPRSAVVWTYTEFGNSFAGQVDHAPGTIAISDDLLFISDITGVAIASTPRRAFGGGHTTSPPRVTRRR